MTGIRQVTEFTPDTCQFTGTGHVTRPPDQGQFNQALRHNPTLCVKMKPERRHYRGQDFRLSHTMNRLKTVSESGVLHHILEQMAEGVCLVRAADSILVYANPVMEQMFGCEAGELIGHPVSRLNAPDEKPPEATAAEIAASVRATGIWHGEIHNIKKDGTRFWSYARISTFEHEVYGAVWLSVREDITRQKQHALQFQALLEAAPDAMVVVDRDGMIRLLNSRLEHLFGYSRLELSGKPVEMLIPAPLRQFHTFHRTAFRLDPQPRKMGSGRELYGLHQTGREVPVDISLSTFQIDDEPLFIAAIRDISEQKRAETALKESEQQFRGLFEQTTDAVFLIGLDLVHQAVNQRAADMLGYAVHELVGMHISEVISPGEYPDSLEVVAALRAGVRLEPYERSFRRKDGTELPVEISSQLIYDTGGTPAYYQSAVRDITERRRTQLIEREQRILATALTDTALALTSTLELREVLRRILLNVHRVVPHHSSTIMLLEDDIARIVQSSGWAEADVKRLMAFEFQMTKVDHLHLMYHTHRPCLIADTRLMPGWVRFEDMPMPLSYLAAPIIVDESVVGFINLDSMEPDYFTPAYADRLQAFAAQTAVAFKNALLYQKAQDLATLEERQRIARDLHDSVSQTLFSTSILTDVLISIWQNDPAAIGDELHELSALAHGALAEMRTLLLELRPEALRDAELPGLLCQLAATLSGRTRVKTVLNIQNEVAAPLTNTARVALFRIAQEALNNVVKHSRAKTVTIGWQERDDHAALQIVDDGRGFVTGTVRAGHFGLKNMQERADEAGLNLVIDSQAGTGTTIYATWRKVQE